MVELSGWFTAKRTLALFCAINVITYLDRGVIAANAVKQSIATEFGLSNAQYFLLPSIFMVGLLLASPVFAQLTRTTSPLKLIGVGLTAWMVAVIGCGAAPGYYALIVCRMLVGVGEASFCSLAAPFINDVAPAGAKSTWLAVFFMCIPSGIALGYVTGGVLFSLTGSWRVPFVVEALLMAPLALFCWAAAASARAPSPSCAAESQPSTGTPLMSGETSRRSSDAEGVASAAAAAAKGRSFTAQGAADVRTVLSHNVFVLAALGYIAYTFTVGILINAGPSAAAAIFPNDFQGALSIDEFFGLVTIVTGVVGTAGGGILLDRTSPTMRNGMAIGAVSSMLAAVLLALCFTINNLPVFVACFVCAELALFAVAGPVNAAYMWSVPAAVRPLACAMTTVGIHLLGDVPSPPLAGLAVDQLQAAGWSALAAWRVTMVVSFGGVALSAVAWGAAAACARSARDYGKLEEAAAHEQPCPDVM